MTQRPTAFVKSLRSNMPAGQVYLWQALRAHRFLGRKVRREVPIGPYVADFVVFQSKLVIEVDGPPHEARQLGDQARDAWFARNGFQTLRITDSDVVANLPAVLRRIEAMVGPSP